MTPFAGGPSPAVVVIMPPAVLAGVIGTSMTCCLGRVVASLELFLLGMFLGHVPRTRLVLSCLGPAGGEAFGLSLLPDVAGL